MFYIDVTRLIHGQKQQVKPTGIDRVMLAYVRHYQNSACAVVYLWQRIWVLSAQQSKVLFLALLSNKSHRLNLVVLLAKSLSLKKVKQGILLLLGHSHLHNRKYIRAITKQAWLPVIFIHDLIPLTHPEYARLGEKERHQARINHALSLAKGLIVNSQDTYSLLSQFASTQGRKRPFACVAPLGVDLTAASPLRPRPVQAPYFVIVGTIEPRKNHLLLLYVWKKLIERFASATPKLIIIGRRGWECEHVTRLLERCPQLRDYIYEWNQCSDEDLSSCLQYAQALLFPSFVEGYGLPLVEALSVGVPVIASSIPVFHEIGREIPDYIDPLDYVQWTETIADYAKPDSLLRQAQQKRLAQYQKPTWEEHFLTTDSFLKSMAG